MSRFSELKKGRRKIEEEKNSSSSIGKTNSNNESYFSKKKKDKLLSTINIDTLQSDLTNLSQTIGNVYNGWQTKETMQNTLSSVQSMYDRLGKYQEYQKKYGGTDLSELQGNFKSLIDEWDILSNEYGRYKNADAYNVAKKISLLDRDYTGLTFDEVQAKKNEFDKNSFEYKYFDNYTKYTDLNEFDKAINDKKTNKTDSGERSSYGRKLDNTNNTLQIKPLGTDLTEGIGNREASAALKASVEDSLNNPTYWASVYENEALKSRDLETERNKWKLDHTFDLYKDVMQNEDFAESSKYVTTKDVYGNPLEKLTKGKYNLGYGDVTYEFINDVDGARDTILLHEKAREGRSLLSDKGYHKLNKDEVAVYNSLYKYDKENGTNKAQKFLDDMEITLTKRVYDENTQTWKAFSDNAVGATVGSILSVPASVFGSIPTLADTIFDAVQGKEYNPYDSAKNLTNFAQDTREYVGENIEESTKGVELFGQNIPSFLYSTGMSIADNLLGANALGPAYLPLMGTNAFHQKAKEMTEAGEDKGTIYATAIASGAAEMVFEKLSLDNFLKIRNVDDKIQILKNAVKQVGIEGSEELFTEISNIMTDSFIRGDNSELSQKYHDLISRGFSQKEAETEIAKQIGSQVAWATAGGALSGGVMGGVGAIGNYIDNSATGKTIKANERVSDMFDIANNPEIGEAYEAYTRYAKKGINEENISNAQLGNLYSSAKTDAIKAYNSKKSTAEQRENAGKTLARLGVVETENTIKKEAKEKFNVGEETKVTDSGVSVDVKDLRIQGDEVKFTTEKGEISVDDITLTQKDAELVTYAQGIAKTDGDEVANLFLNLYDGKTSVEEYANSFNLTMAYSKKNFTFEHILNKKGALSTDDVKAIYRQTRIEADKARQEAIRKLNEDMADKKFYKGFINDSAIDEETWNKLDSRQKQAVVFIKGFAQATGMNLILKHNPNDRHGGAYSVTGNTITIDVAKYENYEGVLKETIIPTMSHETTHWMKDKSPELWTSLNQVVFSTLTNHYNSNTEQSFKDKYALLKKIDPRISEEDARERTITEEDLIAAEMISRGKSEDVSREEIIARACEDMLKMSEQGRKIFHSLSESEQKTLYEKIKGILNDLMNWVNNLLSSYESTSTEARIMREYQAELKKASEIWDKMLEQSVEANQSLEKSGAYNHSNVGESMRYAERPFDEQVDEVLAGTFDRTNAVYVGSTPKILQDIGLNGELPMLTTARHLRDANKPKNEKKHHHGLTKEQLKLIPTKIANPVMIMDSLDSNSNSVVVVTDMLDTNNCPVIVIIKADGDGTYNNVEIKSNFLTGYYGRNKFANFITNNVAADTFLYINKKRSQKLSNSAKVQFLGKLNNYDFDVIIRKTRVNVKTKISTKDSTGRELSEGQQKYFMDSKVRDDNGNLLVMYRGDSDEFTVFDRKKTKHSNLYGRGFYFTNSKAHAEQYGGAREFYLDIKNPLSPKQNAITKKQMLNFLKAIENDGEDYDLYNYGQDATAESVLNSVWGKGDFEMLQDVNAGAIGDLVAAVELFNEVNGTNYDGIILPTETVTFKSEQAKLTSNLNPTENEDIRFSMRENVEETRDLIAVHNVSPGKLLKTLKLGGLPMPSIAITRARDGYNNFGDISLVFNKETIDPQFMRSNKVYSGDAWTPTYPRIEYKLNEKAQEQIKKKIDALVPRNVQSDLGGLHLDSTNMEYELNRNGDMVTSYRYNYAMKYAFLRDSDIKIDLPMKQKSLSRTGRLTNEAIIKVAETIPEETLLKVLRDGNEAREEVEPLIINAINEALHEKYTNPKIIEMLLPKEELSLGDFTDYADDALKYKQNGVQQEVDYREARNLIDEMTDMPKYEAWLKDLFSDVIAKEGIRNDKDLFTPSGNRRSFAALHYEHTLENVVKAMKEEGTKGIGGFGGGNIFGASTKEYGSIDEIRADAENRMHYLPESKYQELRQSFTDRLLEISNALKTHDVFSASDLLIEAVSKFKTKSGMANYLRTESKGWATYSDYIVDDLIELVNDIRNMPAQYFEAKPQRAVGFDEIKAVIMPSQESYEDDLSEVKSELEKLNVPILEYEYGDNNDRLKALNSLENVRFSDRDSDESNVFTDVEGVERSILKHNDLGYKVLGTKKYNSYFPSVQEAIDAENENIKSYYAKKLSVKMSYIDKMLENDPMFLAKLSSNDFRYSDREDINIYDLMGERDRLLKENEKFKDDIERLNERLKLERTVTKGNHFNQNHLGAVAGHLRNIANSNMDKFELMKSLKDVYSFIAQSENLTWEEVFEKCYNVASDIVAEAKPEVEVNDYYKEILRDIKSKKISLSDTQKSEAQYIFGKNWNRNFFGRTTITDNGISLESQWQEWSELYPTIFKSNISDADMPGELYDIIGNLQEASETILEYDEVERTRWLAREVYNQYWNVSHIRTTADKYDKQIKRLNFEHRKAMAEFRNEYKERLEGQKLADDIHYGRKMSEQRESFNSKLAERNAQIQRHKELYKKLRERKDNEIALAKQYGRERLDKYKENAERKTVIQSILATTTSLNKKLVTNSKESHIPETLKPVVINFINAIDFSSKQLLGMKGSKKDMRGTPTKRDMALDNTFSKVKSMSDEELTLKQSIQDALELFENGEKVANNTSDGTMDFSLIALDANLIDSIKTLIKAIDALEKTEGQDFVIQKMDLDSLRVLNAMVKSISNWASKADAALSSKHKERISQLGEGTIEECNPLGQRQNYIDAVESVKNFFSWSNLLPVNAFKRLGKFGEKIFSFLQGAQDTLSFHQEEIINFTNELFKNHKVKEWREEVKEFDLRLPNGRAKKVRMPVSYIMTLYCVAKQEDGMRHLTGRDKDGNQLTYESEGKTRLGGGMTIKGFKEKNSLKVSKDGENTILTEGLISKITSVLTTEQREVADKMQEFMNTKGSEWCDAVSLALYGIKKFGIKDYFPLTVSPNTIKVLNLKDKRQSIHFFSILNYGFTKNRNPKAKQSIEIGDIFETFANHMSMQAIYSAYALPIYDVVRWYNYKRTDLDGSEIGVMNSIENAFGEAATTYIGRLISDLNGQHESSRLGFITKIFKNTKLAMVGNSLSVTLLQPSAYIKAMTKISPKYLIKSALYVKDFGAGKGVKKAKQYCGIALWKSQGNFDTDISRNVSSKIMHDEKWYDKLKELSLSAAGWMDERTWGVLWNACEFDVRENQNDLKVGSQEFYETVANKLRDVIYETQVVDSPLTRSDLMRSGDTGAKMITMFASEITVAYNLVNEAFVNAHLDVKRYGKEAARKRNVKNIAMALTAYTLTSAVSQIIYTAVQAWRDDDEEKEFEDYLKMYLSNFLSDWVLIGKIPYVKDFLNSMQGYSSSRPDTLWLDSTAKAIKYWGRAFDGKEGAGDKAIKESLKALSYLSGVPGYNFYRDTMATLDKLGILDADDFKEMLDDLFD